MTLLRAPVLFALAVILPAATADSTYSSLNVDAATRSLLESLERRMHEQKEQVDSLRHELGEVRAARKLWSNDPGADTVKALDTIWLILCGALVMIMQAGFAMVEAGACRAKNAQHILLKNLTDVCVGTLGWFFFGYTFAYRGDEDGDGFMDNTFIGYLGFAGHDFAKSGEGVQVPADDFASPNAYCHWFFQWAFCSAAATIVSGGVAERVNFMGYLVYSFLMTSFIYPVMVAWTWGYGWIAGEINDIGYIDFAGSGVVHMVGGVGALMGAIFAGARNGRWTNPDEFVPHSTPLVVLGTFILWFGWYGFNCGSTLGMADEATAAKASLVAMNTTTAAATGGLTVVALKFLELKKYDIGAFCNGILGGLVSITAPCSNVDVGSAIFIGLLGGLVYFGASFLLKKLHVDDPLDAFAVHGACGAWGVLAAAVFDWGDGFTYAHGWSGFTCVVQDDGTCDPTGWSKTFAANVVEIIMVIIWSGGLSGIVFAALKQAGWLCADEAEQEAGADAAKHSPPKAYSIADTAEPKKYAADPAPEGENTFRA